MTYRVLKHNVNFFCQIKRKYPFFAGQKMGFELINGEM